MPYARRDPSGLLISLHRDAEPGATELLPDDHPEVQAFVGRQGASGGGFAQLDADFIRVLEDLIDTLISKHLIAITDLPPEAQAKLFSRKGFRERRNRSALQLFDGAEVDAWLPGDRPRG